MLLSTLFDAIRARFPCRRTFCGQDRRLSHFLLLTPGTETAREDCLYVQSAGQPFPVSAGMTVLSFCPETPCPENGNLLCLEERYFAQCLNVLTCCFFEEQEREEAFQRLIPTPANQHPLHTMIDLAAAFLDRSLVLINLSFHVIAASGTVPVTDPIWLRNIARGYCTYEFISAINQLMPDDAMRSSSKVFFVNCSASQENKLCCCVFYEGQPVGYLILLDNEQGVLPYHLEYLPQIGQLVSSALQYSPDYQRMFVNVTENFFCDLLENGADALVRAERLQEDAKLPDSMRCLVFFLKNRSTHDKFYLQRELRLIFPLGYIPIYGEVLVAIVSDQAYRRIFDEAGQESMKIVEKIGISLPFQNIRELPRQFRYAKAACELAPCLGSAGRVNRYEDVQFLHILQTCGDPELLNDYIHPALETLHVYDLAHDTQLFDTLYHYLQRGLCAKEAAEAMFLHRNTLNYRLNKIRDLTDLDLTDPAAVFHLLCSFQINKLLKLY